jgi:hypothetical protein
MMRRPSQKRPFTGRLLKPIDLSEARPRGLRAALAAPPDKSDLVAHYQDELTARLSELNRFLRLAPDDADPERLAKALVEREFEIPRDAPDWWNKFAAYLMRKYVPGFSIAKADKKAHGAPRGWTHERLAQLFADVEYRKKQRGLSAVAVCKALPTLKGYNERWGKWRGKHTALRKAYEKANELRRQDWQFLVLLCGPEALMPEKRGDPIQKAIELHALKI